MGDVSLFRTIRRAARRRRSVRSVFVPGTKTLAILDALEFSSERCCDLQSNVCGELFHPSAPSLWWSGVVLSTLA